MALSGKRARGHWSGRERDGADPERTPRADRSEQKRAEANRAASRPKSGGTFRAENPAMAIAL